MFTAILFLILAYVVFTDNNKLSKPEQASIKLYLSILKAKHPL
jgi:hypothetical protein